jgi:hypothetical protein
MARFLSRNPAGTVADDHRPGIAELGPLRGLVECCILLKMNEPFRSFLPGLVTFIVIAIAWPSMLAADDADACKLLTPADISKTTGLTVAQGTAGRALPGVLLAVIRKRSFSNCGR